MRNKEELDAAWDKATGLHRAGRLAEAETIYRQMLAALIGYAREQQIISRPYEVEELFTRGNS